MRALAHISIVVLVSVAVALPLPADIIASTGNPDGKIAAASRPGSAGQLEIETGDDFVLTNDTTITGGLFYGLVPSNFTASDIAGVTIEIYRVFPKDSTVPASGDVPTRVNSPSDADFDSESGADVLFNVGVISASFTADNSVLNGISPSTTGDGAVTGQEIEIGFTLNSPFVLAADHYFFVPQVQLSNGDFYWLSAPKPIVAPGDPFSPDLQAWIRNGDLSPDWLRIGTDIVGGNPAPTYNMAFELDGTAVPEPAALPILISVGIAFACYRRYRMPG